MSNFKEINFNPGEVIFKYGQHADMLYLIKSGTVEILSEDGISIAKVSEGQSFGEQAFLKGGIRGATTRAVDSVSCIVLSTEEANSLLNKASPLLVPIFEALLLQQNMTNELRKNRKQ